MSSSSLWPVWPDWAIYWTLGNFLKPLATINLPKSHTFLGNFCKGVKIIQFSSETIFGQLLLTFGDFYLVTLVVAPQLLSHWRTTKRRTFRTLMLFYTITYLAMNNVVKWITAGWIVTADICCCEQSDQMGLCLKGLGNKMFMQK